MGLFPDDEWTFATGETPDGPILVRIRTGEPGPEDCEHFRNLVIVRWAYDPAENGGLPSAAVIEKMEVLEEALFAQFDEDSAIGCGVAVMTLAGTREWRFYTPDTPQFAAGFNAALDGLPIFPIEIETFSDPDWNAFAELKPRPES